MSGVVVADEASTSIRDSGKFRILAELGEGGSAQVYLAVASGPAGFNKLVVIKRPRPQVLESAGGRDAFLAEARIAARLNHPNIVQTNEVSDSDVPCIVMEYLDGPSLASLIRKAGARLTLPMHLRIISNVMVGLHYAHELADYDGTSLNLVHRDISPHNVCITFEGQVKLLDFGIAKITGWDQTETGVIKGKVRYMAPEQILGSRFDRRADIFAAGVMIWEAAAGRRMWEGATDVQVMNSICNGHMASPRSVCPTVSDELERICMKALSADPDQRYNTADDLALELEQYAATLGHRVNTRDIAVLVSSIFAEERERTKAKIDAQLRQIAPLGGPSQAGHVSEPTELFPKMKGRVGEATTATGMRPAGALPTVGGTRRIAVYWLAGLGIVSVAIAGAIYAGSSRVARETTVAVRPIVAAVASSAPTAVARESKPLQLTVTATPSSARIYCDGVQLPGNPVSYMVPANQQSHTVRVTATGYVDRQTDVVLDKDVDLSIVLERAKIERGPVSPAVPSNPKRRPGGLVNEL